jgi:hypothetical protein
MADWVSSLFVIALLLGYAALLIGLLVWMLHGWAGPRLKAWSSRRLSPRLKSLRLLHRDQ